MKVVQINSTCGLGSTGKICVAISDLLTKKGIVNYILYAFGDSNSQEHIQYISPAEIKIQALKAKMFGNYGFQSKGPTKRLIAELERISPDIVHLHNLHSHNVHLGDLFTYFKENKIKVFWTFHDCWAFTGYCPHFDMIGCEKWKNSGCGNCPQRAHYSWFFDRSSSLFERKKELFSGIDMTIITPSEWLASLVKQSFLKKANVKVINNGIDLSVFYPRKSDFRDKYNLNEKFVVLGVAFEWGYRKGLDVFIKMSQKLDDRFSIVLVGTNDNIDKTLPSNIISIHRTQNQSELAEIYSAADVFVNPTREENFPTTHLESLACGTPVVAFNTGGCSEMLDTYCGVVTIKDDVNMMLNTINEICLNNKFENEYCQNKALDFSAEKLFDKYISLYLD